MALTFSRGVLTAAALLGAGLVLPPAGGAAEPVVGQVVTLQAGTSEVPAILRERQVAERRGAILLLPAPGEPADAAGLVRALRLGLPEAGWDTLSLQLPDFFAGDSAARWLARHQGLQAHVRAGLDRLGERGGPNPVIIAIGSSGEAALAFAAAAPPDTLQAVVLVGTAVEPGSPAAQHLAALRLPLLDLYAERDRRDVLDTRATRRLAAADNDRYGQRVVAGADDRYNGTLDVVVAAVRAWLAANTGTPQ